MSTKADDIPYESLVARAEHSVAGVKDPELRRVAFEKVLEDLLSSHSRDAKAVPPGLKAPEASKTAPRKRRTRPAGPQGYVKELIEEGFFAKPKTLSEVKAELENRGHHIPLEALGTPLQRLCKKKVLRRQKTSLEGKKQTYSYSKW